MGEVEEGEAALAVVAEWRACPSLVHDAAGGIMCKIGKQSELTRPEVCANVKVLLPMVKHYGFLASFCKASTCRTEAFDLAWARSRKLWRCFSTIAARAGSLFLREPC